MSFTRFLGNAGLFFKKYYPEFMLAGGIGASAASVVLAAKQGKKVAEKELGARAAIQRCKDIIASTDTTTSESEKKECEAYVKTVEKDIVKTKAKAYALPAGLAIVGAGLIIGSHCVIRHRLTVTAGSLAAVTAAYANYRKQAEKKLGEQAKDIKAEKLDKKTGEMIPVSDPTTLIFDGNSSYLFKYQTSDDEMKEFLKATLEYLNDKLHRNGHVFLNEVYDELGVKRTEEGQYIGWLYDPDSMDADNFIDFGEQWKTQTEQFTLVFNFDGNILEKGALKKG